MSSYSPDYFIHAANILLLVAYSVRDILWLRLFAVGSLRRVDPVFSPAADNVVGAARVDGWVCRNQLCCSHGASSWSVDPSS